MSTTIDYDIYGHCVKCHKNLRIKEVFNNEYRERWLPTKNETEYMLDDGSCMRVTMCTPCKNKLTLSDKENKEIMDIVIRGWDRESDMLVADKDRPSWTKESKDKYMKAYSKKYIVMNSENIDKKVLKEVFKKKKDK
jgi:hypothetical protein